MAKTTVPRHRDAEALSGLLATPEIQGLIADLEATRWTGRPGYPIPAMVAMCLIKALYVIPTWSRVVRLVAEHEALQRVLGATPSADACYRFTRKLRVHSDALTVCIDSVLTSLATENPAMGEAVAIDGSDLPAYSNGQGKAKGSVLTWCPPRTLTHRGVTVRLFRPVVAASTSVSRFTPSWTWRRSFPLRGRCAQQTMPNR